MFSLLNEYKNMNENDKNISLQISILEMNSIFISFKIKPCFGVVHCHPIQ